MSENRFGSWSQDRFKLLTPSSNRADCSVTPMSTLMKASCLTVYYTPHQSPSTKLYSGTSKSPEHISTLIFATDSKYGLFMET